MLNFMQPISGSKMLGLKKEIAELKKSIKKCNDDKEIRRLKKRLMEKETHYNILADKAKMG